MKTTLKSVISALLILLFVYAAISKLLSYPEFEQQLHNQTFPGWIADILLYTLIPVELLTAILLYFPRTQKQGLFLSAMLLFLFSGYIALVLLGAWNRVPCSCGGILTHMSWTAHLIFNCIFLLLNLTAMIIRPVPSAIPV